VVMLRNPVASAATLTLFMAGFLMFAGFLRIVASLVLKMSAWGWVMLNGIISLTLGVLILYQWPVSALWVIGLFIGIELLMHGISLCALAFTVHQLDSGPTLVKPAPQM
jgi:uncharacterized membrane protein HdeD (DUF308 family)